MVVPIVFRSVDYRRIGIPSSFDTPVIHDFNTLPLAYQFARPDSRLIAFRSAVIDIEHIIYLLKLKYFVHRNG